MPAMTHLQDPTYPEEYTVLEFGAISSDIVTLAKVEKCKLSPLTPANKAVTVSLRKRVFCN